MNPCAAQPVQLWSGSDMTECLLIALWFFWRLERGEFYREWVSIDED